MISALILLLALGVSLLSTTGVHAAQRAYVDASLQAALAAGQDPIEFVVTYDHQPTAADVDFLRGLNVRAVVMDYLPMATVIGDSSSVQALAGQPGVLSLAYNSQLQYDGQAKGREHFYGTVPVSESWWISTMNVEKAWTKGIEGQGIGIAVVDSGVDATNPSLGYRFPSGERFGSERVIQNVKVLTVGELVTSEPLGPDQLYIENQPDTDTSGGHGTSVAGSAAGTGAASDGVYLGVAPKANIIGLGAGDTLVIFHIVASFNYILGHREQYNIRINSNSWGPGNDDPADPINVATKKMHDAGIAVFFSVGNSGPGPGTIGGFKVHPWVIAIAASQYSKGLTRFSSRGFPDDLTRIPAVTAPGENLIVTRAITGTTDTVLSPTDVGNVLPQYLLRYTTFGGTSGAAPMAAGVGALVLSANPSITPDQLKDLLKATADPMPGYLPFQVGAGHINAGRAVEYALTGAFEPGNIKVEAKGLQKFHFVAFEAFGLAVPVASTPIDNNFPTFNRAERFDVTVSWQNPSTPAGWVVRLYTPTDQSILRQPIAGGASLNGVASEPATTSLSFSMVGADAIASHYNPGFTMGTWDVAVFNTGAGEKYNVDVTVTYPQHGKMSLRTGLTVETQEQGFHESSGEVFAVFQNYDGSIQARQSLGSATSGIPLSITATLTQPQGQIVQVVQIVVADGRGNTIEWLDGFVMTQTDISARISEIQTQLLTATPVEAATLQAELAQLNAVLLAAPLTESLTTA